jgi:hypothetical protein
MLIRREILIPPAEDDLKRGEVAFCAVGGVEPMVERGLQVVAIWWLVSDCKMEVSRSCK